MTSGRLPDERAGQWIREVLDRYERPLTSYAAAILGDLERGRDAVQETFLRLCKQERGAVEGHLPEWLFTLCRNQALDARRKASRMNSMSGDRRDGVAVAASLAAPSPVAEVETRDSVAQVLAVLEGLPPKQQEVLRLKFQHGLSYKEISRVMDESIGNVGWLIHVGVKSLRGRLAEEGAEA